MQTSSVGYPADLFPYALSQVEHFASHFAVHGSLKEYSPLLRVIVFAHRRNDRTGEAALSFADAAVIKIQRFQEIFHWLSGEHVVQIVIAHSVHTFCVLRICRNRPDRFFPGCKLFCSEFLNEILILLITIAEKRNTVFFPAHEEVFYNIRNLIFHKRLLCFGRAKFSLERLNTFFCFLDTFVHRQNIALFRFD